MSDEPQEDRGTSQAHEDEAARVREEAAALAGAAESMAELGEHLDELSQQPGGVAGALGLPDLAGFTAGTRARAANLRLVSDIEAAQARAQQEMLHAGGPEDDEAYAAFVEATERHTDLLPPDEEQQGGSIE
jgi:hypothetical protein